MNGIGKIITAVFWAFLVLTWASSSEASRKHYRGQEQYGFSVGHHGFNVFYERYRGGYHLRPGYYFPNRHHYFRPHHFGGHVFFDHRPRYFREGIFYHRPHLRPYFGPYCR